MVTPLIVPRSKTILYLQFANPAAYPPIEYSARILADRGWKIRLLGVQSDGPHALEFLTHPQIRCDVMPYIPPGWRQKLAYLRFLFHAFKIVRYWKPDWLYVSDFMAAPVGMVLRRTLGCKMIYHEHDSPAPNARSWFIRLVLGARKSIACTAEFNILPQAERIALFTKETGTKRPVHCVWNCPPRADTQEVATRLRKPDEPLSIYFHGSINMDRVPLALIEGAKRCGVPIRIRIVGYETIGSKGAVDQLRAAAQKGGPNVVLEFPGPVSRQYLRQLMKGMHVGWINFINRSDDRNLLHLVGASNKAFDYLAFGLPLIVPDVPDWQALFVDRGYARACNAADPDAIASTLSWFYENSAAAAEMGNKGRARCEAEWNYENQFRKVLKVLNGKAASRCLTYPIVSWFQDRQFHWTSSVSGDEDRLRELQGRLKSYYSEWSSRSGYQSMLGEAAQSQPKSEAALLNAILASNPESVLEIGCGSGWLYQRLTDAGLDKEAYAGLEMSQTQIDANIEKFPRASWHCGSIYVHPFGGETFGVVFSYFVLEHLVFPAKALQRMLDLTRPGGKLVLVFPDFVAAGRLASQKLGLRDRRASELLRQGDICNALFNLYESRFRLPRALRSAVGRHGPFPVNLRPRCILEPEIFTPDVDAVYIASKDEVAAWASEKGCTVSYPAGRQRHFRDNALVELTKPAA